MEFTTQNGKDVNIIAAPTRAAMRLKREVMKHLKNKGLIDKLQSGDLSKISMSDVLDLLIDIDTSEEFEKAVFECLKVCIYDTMGKRLRISEQLFDDLPDARDDYYEIISKCCEVNLLPFFKSLFSALKTRLEIIPDENPQSA